MFSPYVYKFKYLKLLHPCDDDCQCCIYDGSVNVEHIPSRMILVGTCLHNCKQFNLKDFISYMVMTTIKQQATVQKKKTQKEVKCDALLDTQTMYVHIHKLYANSYEATLKQSVQDSYVCLHACHFLKVLKFDW